MNDQTKIFWLGQAGLYFEIAGKKIIVDPYLSDSVEKINPSNYRRVPVKKELLEIKPDIIILTHDHLDHTDPETLKHYLNADRQILILASENAWQEVRKFSGKHNYVRFNRHTEWTEEGIRFCAVYAAHSDPCAVGVVIDDGTHKYYVTGDTLYNTDIFKDLPKDLYAVFLPINGVGNNMNQTDAKRFAKECGAKHIIPMHFGLFDEIEPDGFEIVPNIYEEVTL